MIYFIKSGNYCKIGFTRDAKALFTRLRTYLTHNPSFQILDLRKGDKIVEKIIHDKIPMELYHYGEWRVWNKKIAQIWIDYYKIGVDNLEEYFMSRNKMANKAIVNEFKDTPYLNFIRYFSHESNLDLTEPDETEWRTP